MPLIRLPTAVFRFKAELIQNGSFIDERDAQIEISEYIDYYYNTKRKHSSIAYKTPKQFEENLTKAA